MAWKSTVPWLGSGAAILTGLVWAYRSLQTRGDLSRRLKDASPPPLPDEGPVTLRPSDEDDDDDPILDIEDIDVATAASDDARRDLGLAQDEWDAIELEPSGNPEPIESSDIATVSATQHISGKDELYDAVDTETLGAEWLRRATQAEPAEGQAPLEALDGMHLVDPEAEEDRVTEQPPTPWTPTDEELARLVAAELHHSKH